MEHETMRKLVLRELIGGLWHTTHPDRFAHILVSGGILPNPDLPDTKRWKAAHGPHYHPFVRTLGGVSLFDFHQFNPEDYSEKYPLSSWAYFVPYSLEWGCAVWIEIDREQTSQNFVSASEVVAKWTAEKAHRHTIMPNIEAAHLGMLPRSAFKRAFKVYKEDSEIHPLEI
jgi:hypothetical protein